MTEAFKRGDADSVYLSRASSTEWEVAVRAIGAEQRPIVLQRAFDGLNYITLDMAAAQARALAQELLHAADVAEAAKQGGADDAMLKARLIAAQQPAEGEEIMVNTPYDVFTLPLRPSGLSSGQRFVVHVPGPEQPAAVDGAIDKARFERAPCYLCGYNGPGYYQPDTHPCAAKYHAAQQQGCRAALEKDAAKYRWGINNARWIRGEREAYVAIPVAPDADLSCVAMRDAAIDAAMQRTTGREGEQ